MVIYPMIAISVYAFAFAFALCAIVAVAATLLIAGIAEVYGEYQDERKASALRQMQRNKGIL